MKLPAILVVHDPSMRRLVAGGLLAWTGLPGASLAWTLRAQQRQIETMAIDEARALFNKDRAFRLWGASHGGVYVPVTEDTPPSPFLAHIPERDVSTPGGQAPTPMNPACMVRR